MDRPETRWPAANARAWYKKQPWLMGFNYVPSTAVNTTEFWQADTFDETTIQRELGWAADVGFNSCRVFLQHLVWEQDGRGFKRRFDRFLALAAAQKLSVMPVLLDDCAFSKKPPFLGKQDEPVPDHMMTSWTASPGHDKVKDPAGWVSVEQYFDDLMTSFGADRRVLAWDLYNEPGNEGMGDQSLPLLEAAFGWARTAAPCQPITAGIWNTDPASLRMNTCMRQQSDVITFHRYADLPGTESLVTELAQDERPLICTEWMARPLGSRIETHLPMFRERLVGCYIWGLMNGRTQTHCPWDFIRDKVGTSEWFHDLLRSDGTPYAPAEVDLLKQHSPRRGRKAKG